MACLLRNSAEQHSALSALILSVIVLSVAFHLLLFWLSLCWVSLCWMSRRHELFLIEIIPKISISVWDKSSIPDHKNAENAIKSKLPLCEAMLSSFCKLAYGVLKEGTAVWLNGASPPTPLLECRCLQKCFLIWNYYVCCLWAPLLLLTQSKETVFWSNLVFFTIKARFWQYYS